MHRLVFPGVFILINIVLKVNPGFMPMSFFKNSQNMRNTVIDIGGVYALGRTRQ